MCVCLSREIILDYFLISSIQFSRNKPDPCEQIILFTPFNFGFLFFLSLSFFLLSLIYYFHVNAGKFTYVGFHVLLVWKLEGSYLYI